MIEIPQNILNKFIVRRLFGMDKKSAAICVYLDLTNMLHWQGVLGWKFRIEMSSASFYRFKYKRNQGLLWIERPRYQKFKSVSQPDQKSGSDNADKADEIYC